MQCAHGTSEHAPDSISSDPLTVACGSMWHLEKPETSSIHMLSTPTNDV